MKPDILVVWSLQGDGLACTNFQIRVGTLFVKSGEKLDAALRFRYGLPLRSYMIGSL